MKCFEFNHKANECQNDTRCKNCNGNHSIEDCASNTTKCCNCGEQQKATFKQCKQYADKALEKINKIKEKRAEGKTKSIRMYSEVSSKKTNINSSDNQILKAIQELKESNIKYENNINEKFEELMKKEKTNGERIEEL